MKRLFLMTIAMFSMTMTFAENEEATNVTNVEAYDMSVNMRKLCVALDLNADQIEAVESIHNTFKAEMQLAAQNWRSHLQMVRRRRSQLLQSTMR